jgi:hypothetical protein
MTGGIGTRTDVSTRMTDGAVIPIGATTIGTTGDDTMAATLTDTIVGTIAAITGG